MPIKGLMMDKIRWGIIGTGLIAGKFADGLRAVADAELVAVGSRTQASAEAFATTYNVPRCYPTYEELAQDPNVDVVYISTPHPYHKDNSILCLNAGKAVLCEKPFTMNAREAIEMIALARSKRLFLMEAMWTRYFPAMVKVRELLGEGAIGEARLLNADFGFFHEFDAQHRLFNPDLGGGAVLDVGVYVISLAHMIFGKPTRVTGLAHFGATGTDDQSAYLLGYSGGQIAMLASAVQTETPHQAVINGTAGRITIHRHFWQPRRLTLEIYGKESSEIEMPIVGNGYNYQVDEVHACLRAGKLESSIMPLDESLDIMETMDTLRAQWGLRYPME